MSHPLWLQLARSLQFKTKLFKGVGSKRHINLLELDAVLSLERSLVLEKQDCRYALGADSQVSLACLVKGRSSSPRLNKLLQRSLPTMLGGGLYGNYGFVPSLANAADDPTRGQQVRAPQEPMPDWLRAAFVGDFEGIDRWLEGQGYDPMAVANLPFGEGTNVSKEAVCTELLPKLRAVQKPDRLDKFDEDQAKAGSSTASAFSAVKNSSFSADACIGSPDCTDSLVGQPLGNFVHVSPPVIEEEKEKDENGAEESEDQTKVLNKRPKKKRVKNRGKAHQKTYRCCFDRGAPSDGNSRLGSSEPPGCVRAAVDMASAATELLPEAASALLTSFPHGQFFAPGGRRAKAGFAPKGKGFLDLYSGACGVAR